MAIMEPRISFCLFSYNQENFISAAIDGALDQTYSPLEIVISDDCSTDRTYEIILEKIDAYTGPHKVIVNRNATNMGLTPHFNKLMKMASGDIVVVAAGDDISMPDRVAKSHAILTANPHAACMSFQLQRIDADGAQLNNAKTKGDGISCYGLTDFIAGKSMQSSGASRAYRKDLFEFYGPLMATTATEDTTMLLRCLMHGEVACAESVEVEYRVHGNNYHSSNNKFSIDYNGIYDQYLKDMEVACRRGKISLVQKDQLENIFAKRLKINTLLCDFHNADSKTLFFLSRILFDRSMKMSKKIKLILKR